MSKPVVFLTRDDFPSNALKLLEPKFEVRCWPARKPLTPELFKEGVKGVYAIYCTPANKIDMDLVNAAGDSLKVISTYSVGFDHIDVKGVTSCGIKLGYVPTAVTEATAEHAVAILLATSRHIVESYLTIHKNEWTRENWAPTWFCGYGLENSTVGIIGCGRIGSSFAKKIKGFSIKRLLYFSQREKPDVAALGGELKSVDEIMKESDFVLISMVQTEETKGIINRARINSMKPNAIIVNISRGGLIDEDALVEALQNKKIAGAGLDVLRSEPIKSDHPLLKMNNVVITPHIGSATYECRTTMAEVAANNIIAVLENRKMPFELK